MKKQLTVMLLMFVLLLTMAGCSTAHAVQKLDAAEEKVEAKLDMVEEKVEEKLEEAIRKAREMGIREEKLQEVIRKIYES